MSNWYRLEGHTPVLCRSAEAAMQSVDERCVAREEATPDITVSTVFLALDHQWGDGPPMLFETMVFGGLLNEEMGRYSTWEQAEEGHKDMVNRVREALKKGA